MLHLDKFEKYSNSIEASFSFGMVEHSRFEQLKKYILGLPVCTFVETEFETGDPGDEHVQS